MDEEKVTELEDRGNITQKGIQEFKSAKRYKENNRQSLKKATEGEEK